MQFERSAWSFAWNIATEFKCNHAIILRIFDVRATLNERERERERKRGKKCANEIMMSRANWNVFPSDERVHAFGRKRHAIKQPAN